MSTSADLSRNARCASDRRTRASYVCKGGRVLACVSTPVESSALALDTTAQQNPASRRESSSTPARPRASLPLPAARTPAWPPAPCPRPRPALPTSRSAPAVAVGACRCSSLSSLWLGGACHATVRVCGFVGHIHLHTHKCAAARQGRAHLQRLQREASVVEPCLELLHLAAQRRRLGRCRGRGVARGGLLLLQLRLQLRLRPPPRPVRVGLLGRSCLNALHRSARHTHTKPRHCARAAGSAGRPPPLSDVASIHRAPLTIRASWASPCALPASTTLATSSMIHLVFWPSAA